MRMIICAAMIMYAASLAAADDKPAVKEIPTKDVKINFKSGLGTSTIDKPIVFTSAEEIAKHAALKDAVDDLKKEVDFEKEKLVFFFWGSFDMQQIVPDPDKPGTFTYRSRFAKGGGFKSNAKLFVVPKDAEVKITQKK